MSVVRFVAGPAGALALAWLLAACTTTTDGPIGASRDVPTASDQTDADRRARVRLELATAYFARGQINTALDEVKLALAAKPDLPEAFNLRGLIYAQMGEEALAEESYRRALQLRPRDGDTMHNYGWMLCQQRRWADADAQFRAALALPQYANAARTMLAQGVCHARAGQWDAAEAALVRSYEADPTSPVAAVNLAEVLYRREQYERARFYIRRVNARTDLVNAQTLWLAARIEHKLGNAGGAQVIGRELQLRFPQSNEALAYERGQFND